MRTYGTSGPDLGLVVFLLIALSIVILAAWIVSIVKLVEAYKLKQENGQDAPTGVLWLIGLFASPVVLGLYVCALPNRSERTSSKKPETELPAV